MSGKSHKYLIFFVFVFDLIWFARGTETDITITVRPGTEECFYETLQYGQTLEIDYQVIDGGHGDLDISFYLTSPNGREVIIDFKKSEQSHRYKIKHDGDYKMCFDNTFSSFNQKVVYFEFMIDSDEDLWGNLNGARPDEQYDSAMQDIQEVMNRMKLHLFKIRHMQETARAFALRDKHIAEGNLFLVNTWSLLQIIVMLFVGMIQVVMVKSLFDQKSRMRRLWALK